MASSSEIFRNLETMHRTLLSLAQGKDKKFVALHLLGGHTINGTLQTTDGEVLYVKLASGFTGRVDVRNVVAFAIPDTV